MLMTFFPSNVQTGACSSSSTRSLKCVPLALSSLIWSVRYDSGLVRVAVVIGKPRHGSTRILTDKNEAISLIPGWQRKHQPQPLIQRESVQIRGNKVYFKT